MTIDRKGPWMQTYGGMQFWPFDPRPEDINLIAMAHALGNTCRYNGQCNHFYSVAEHSVLVSENVPEEDALWSLMHDASEAYIGDIIRPIKPHVLAFQEIEAGIMAAVCQRFGLPPEMPASVKHADTAILADEQPVLMPEPPEPWHLPYPPLKVKIRCLNPYDATQAFLGRFAILKAREKA